MQEGVNIGIVVKDFKAIISHANTLRADVAARYSHPNRPLQLAYERNGMTCEFTLMTRIGRGTSVSTAGTPARELSARPASVAPQQNHVPVPAAPSRALSEMAPPNPPASRSFVRPEISQQQEQEEGASPPSASLNPNSLFVPADDDRQWDEPEYNDDEDMIGWDASADNVRLIPTKLSSTGAHRQERTPSMRASPAAFKTANRPRPTNIRMAYTQVTTGPSHQHSEYLRYVQATNTYQRRTLTASDTWPIRLKVLPGMEKLWDGRWSGLSDPLKAWVSSSS